MKSKRILVTGGAGFIGANFIYTALAASPDYHITNLDSLTYAGNLGNLSELSPEQSKRYRFIHGDIRDHLLLNDIFKADAYSAVVNFAAESHVDRSILGPSTFLDTNVNGTFCLLESCLKMWENTGRPSDFRLLHISTDEVYGSLGVEGRFTEKTPYDPSSPYSASKASSDHFVKAYFKTYGLPALVTNCSNNFGPYQFPEKLIPLMIMNIIEEKPLPVYGDGMNVRDWLFVIDHCEAVLTVLEKGKPGETYNIGGGTELPNIRIVTLLCDLLDGRLGRSGDKGSRRLIQYVKDRPGHDRRYAIDATKIKNDLEWKPRYPFEEAIKTTIDWYLSHMEWVNSVRSGEYRKWVEKNYGNR